MATVNLDCRLDLKTIALHARNAEYNPKVSSPPSFLLACLGALARLSPHPPHRSTAFRSLLHYPPHSESSIRCITTYYNSLMLWGRVAWIFVQRD